MVEEQKGNIQNIVKTLDKIVDLLDKLSDHCIDCAKWKKDDK